jgi:hypothetical protein
LTTLILTQIGIPSVNSTLYVILKLYSSLVHSSSLQSRVECPKQISLYSIPESGSLNVNSIYYLWCGFVLSVLCWGLSVVCRRISKIYFTEIGRNQLICFHLKMGYWWVIKIAILFRKRAEIPKFPIYERYIEFFYFSSNFDVFFFIEWIVLRAFDSMSMDYWTLNTNLHMNNQVSVTG